MTLPLQQESSVATQNKDANMGTDEIHSLKSLRRSQLSVEEFAI